MNITHSYSRIARFMACPLLYEEIYLRGSVGDTAVLQAGSFCHRVFDAYSRHCIASGLSTDLLVVEGVARAEWISMQSELASERRPFLLDDDVFEELMSNVIEPWSNTHTIPMSAHVEEQIAVTREMSETGWLSDDVWFRARIDLWHETSDGGAVIFDYKTGHSLHEDPLQAETYAWILMSLYPRIEQVVVTMDHVRFNIRRSRTFCRSDLPRLDRRIRRITGIIESGIRSGVPTPGAHCRTCHVAACPARPVIHCPVTTPEQARETAASLALLRRDMDRATESLRAWCEQHGPVSANGTVWGHFVQGDVGYDDAKAFYEAAVAAGLDPWKYLTVNNARTRSQRVRGALPENLLVDRRRVVFTSKQETDHDGTDEAGTAKDDNQAGQQGEASCAGQGDRDTVS